ncbi:MAG: hypothetical protein AAGA85_18485 [Bacteroidota bacterium]
MSKARSDQLFQLIKSLRKSEKRYFKTQCNQSGKSDLKYIKLFDAIDNLKRFEDESQLLDQAWINPAQFSNLKAHLYKRILQSLKDYAAASNEELAIREQIDYVQILFDRSLYSQSIQLLDKVKRAVRNSENLELQLEVLKWERNLLPFSIGKNNRERVQEIVRASNDVNDRISRTNLLTNLLVELNAIYLQFGYIRSKEDFDHINQIFKDRLPKSDATDLSLREKLLWYEIYHGYYSFIQDLDNTYVYAKYWVDLFPNEPHSAFLLEKYLKGLNHLLNAQSRLRMEREFVTTHKRLRSLEGHPLIAVNENLRIRLFKYSYAHQFNKYFMVGDFTTGGLLLSRIESRLEQFIGMIDKHSELILFYKIACLHFGNQDYRAALKWLNRIINSEDLDIREDVHSFARIINLITHYELGNRDVLEYAVRSTYRFLLKKEDLHHFQQCILDFIKNLSWSMTDEQLIQAFKHLRTKLLPIASSQYDRRAFVYFDIISWLESKIENRPIESVVKDKLRLPPHESLEMATRPSLEFMT